MFQKSFSYGKNGVLLYSPLGIPDQPQIYYWNTNKDKYYLTKIIAQISGLRYDTVKEKYVGLELDSNTKVKKHVVLQDSWMRENFPDLMEPLKTYANLQKVKYYRVPLADSRISEINNLNDNNPVIAYPQDDEKSCCFNSLACALFFLGYESEAKQIMYYKDYFFQYLYKEKFYQIAENIIEYIRLHISFRYLRIIYDQLRITSKHDVLNFQCSKEDIRLLILAGKDGGESHAICVVDTFIFDSNCKNALCLNTLSLNDCCSGVEFDHVVKGYHFKKRK